MLIGLYLFLMHRLVHRKYRDITRRTICRVQDSAWAFSWWNCCWCRW
ncbi:MAG: hypothetical protein ACLR5S_12535 [Ruminococcus sp.]